MTTKFCQANGVFYPHALDKDLVFELTLAPASQVVRGSDTSRLVCKLKNIKLFIVPYTAGTRDSENYFNPDITNVEVTINGIPNSVYNNGIKGRDMWREASRLFSTKSKKNGAGIYSPNMTLAKYLTSNKFGFFLDLRSMAGTNMHGSGQRLVNSKNGVQIALTRTNSGSGTV